MSIQANIKQQTKWAAKVAAANSFEAVAGVVREVLSQMGRESQLQGAAAADSLAGIAADLEHRGSDELLVTIRRVEHRGAIYSVHRCPGTSSQIFRYAIATGRSKRNPAADLWDALPQRKETKRPQHSAQMPPPVDSPRYINTVLNHRIASLLPVTPFHICNTLRTPLRIRITLLGRGVPAGAAEHFDRCRPRIREQSSEDRMSTARPGIALRNLRKRNHWTLAAVSERTGIPASTLSRIENDQMSPTYDLLVRVSNGLSIDLSQLLSMPETQPELRPEQTGRRSVNRKNDGDVVEMPGHTLRYLSTDMLNKQVTPILCEYRARSLADFGTLMRHAGEEFLYIIEGELELHTEIYAPVVLKAGESTYFDSSMGHAYIARGDVPCRALSICTVGQPAEHAVQAEGPVKATAQAVSKTVTGYGRQRRPRRGKREPRPR